MKRVRTGTHKSSVRAAAGSLTSRGVVSRLGLGLLLLFLTLPDGSLARAQTAPSRLDRARELIAEEKRTEAVPLLEAELRERPDHHEARMLLARILSWERQYDRSLA